MRTLVHLSDLHFGRVDAALLEPLCATVNALRPDVVVVSGDLTQRARRGQFLEARRFLDRLPSPQIVVPGNHDVPLHDVVSRFLRPLAGFRAIVTPDLEPVYVDDEIAVVGINTARSLTFKGGRISHRQIERVRERLCALDGRVVKVIVTHHPFDLPPGGQTGDIVGRAADAMAMFARCGAHLLLAGHLHQGHLGSTAERYRLGGYEAVVVQAGTATSTRGRGEANSFNVIRIARPTAEIERHEWSPAAGAFVAAAVQAVEIPAT